MKNPLTGEQYLERKITKNYFPRTDYFRDQTAIIHSMPFRRLKQKTQVIFSPQNDHVCTRIEHVLHVASIAATICKGINASNNAWNLNEELAYAIGVGHDLGHAPFGHSGEKVLSDLLGGGNSFIHEVNSFRVVEYLANNGEGMNLTYAVKDGIICHCGEKYEKEIEPRKNYIDLNEIKDRKEYPSTFEGCITRFSDKIAYFGRDLEDAVLAKLIAKDEIPSSIQKELGKSNGEIINTLVIDIIENSKNNGSIKFSEEKHRLILELRDFNNKYIYNHRKILKWRTHGERIIKVLFEYLLDLYDRNGKNIKKYYKDDSNKLDQIFANYLKKMIPFYKKEDTAPKQIIADYISGMTDEFALKCMEYISIPEPLDF